MLYGRKTASQASIIFFEEAVLMEPTAGSVRVITNGC